MILLLTVRGEFIVKSLILLTAGMVVGATVRSNGSGGSPTENIETTPTH